MRLSNLFLRRVSARTTQCLCEKRLCLEQRRLVPEMLHSSRQTHPEGPLAKMGLTNSAPDSTLLFCRVCQRRQNRPLHTVSPRLCRGYSVGASWHLTSLALSNNIADTQRRSGASLREVISRLSAEHSRGPQQRRIDAQAGRLAQPLQTTT